MRLMLKSGQGNRRAFAIEKECLRIGRLPDNDIVLDGNFVSRYHAKIVVRGGHVYVVDLDSRNGTFVNSMRARERRLSPGDQIAIGPNVLCFEDRAVEDVVYSEDDMMLQSEGTIIKSLSESSSLQSLSRLSSKLAVAPRPSPHGGAPAARGEVAPEAADIARLEAEERNLKILYEVAEQLTTTIELSEMLDRIMNLVMEVIEADRGYLLLIASSSEDLVPMVVKTRPDKGALQTGGEIEISRTIVNTVIRDKVSVRTSNAGADSRFERSKSIMSFGITQAMVVPLWKGEDVIGVIYLDALTSIQEHALGTAREKFSENDLDLLTAIGHQAALFIEQVRLVEQFQKERDTRTHLERFLPRQVVDHLISEGLSDELSATEATATILFSDICGFTRLSERINDPGKIATMLNEYFGLMTDVLFEFGGTLDKFLGDGLMALFGVPTPLGDDVERSLRCALKMLDEVTSLMQDKPPEERFEVRIGVNTGKVVAGTIGSVKRGDYTVLGDTVNTAARIMDLANPGQVYVGDETRRACQSLFEFEELGLRRVKGKENEILVHRLVELRG